MRFPLTSILLCIIVCVKTASFAQTSAPSASQTLFEALHNCREDDVARLLNVSNVNAPLSDGLQPLHKATNCSVSMVRLLIEKGADINAKNNDEETPLHRAVWQSNLDVIRLLIEKGATVNAKGNGGRIPLHEAAFKGNPEVVRLLIEKGATVNAKDSEGKTPLYWAATAINGIPDIIRLLIEKGADVNAKNNNGITPLYVAKVNKHIAVADYLRSKGGTE